MTSACIDPEVRRSRSHGYHIRCWHGYTGRYDFLSSSCY